MVLPVDIHREYRILIEPLLNKAAGYANSILRNRADAEDALQEAALKGFKKFQTYDAGKSFKGWWFAIVHNCCIDLFRERQRSRRYLNEMGERANLSSVPDGFTEARLDLPEAMQKLSQAHREILNLRYDADCSYLEIAESLKIPQGTVMSRLHKAREKLSELMNEVRT